MTTTQRRGFLRDSFVQLVGLLERRPSQPTFELSLLAGLSEEGLGGLIPAIEDVSVVNLDDGRFLVELPGGIEEVLFRAGSFEEDAWSRMDGRSSIVEIAEDLAVEWDVDHAEAFARTRALFLHLVRARLCTPCNPLE